jgi:signal transduction histidine kinase
VRRLALREPGLQIGPGLQQPVLWNLDSARLEQALINLIENARIALQAQAEGGVYIDAELRAEGLSLQVCDNGPGVPPELRDRLFEPFASRSPGGTGLGLAIVARIAAAHGGSVQLSEHAGWRTCFSLQFPKIDET